jgi:hypothetical protein
MYDKITNTYPMTEEEIWMEEIWDKIQRCEYIVCDDMVYDFESGEFIIEMWRLQQ